MGVMTRKAGEYFVITSDRVPGEEPINRAPKRHGAEPYQVWTDRGWSTTLIDAKTFATDSAADDFVRANFLLVMGHMTKR